MPPRTNLVDFHCPCCCRVLGRFSPSTPGRAVCERCGLSYDVQPLRARGSGGKAVA